MKKSQLPFILFGILGIVLLVYFLMSGESEKRFKWNETYTGSSDQPYGTIFIKEILEAESGKGEFIFNHDKPVKEIFKENKLPSGTNYVFIGQSIHLDHDDRYQLMKYVEEGHDAFIASLDPPEDLINGMHIDFCDSEIEYVPSIQENVTMNFFHDSLKITNGFPYKFRQGFDDRFYNWSAFNDEIFCESQNLIIPLGYHGNEKINFVKIPFGKGNFYFHCNPLVFTNYFLIHEENLKYPEAIFSFLDGQNTLWDEYSKIPYSRNKNTYDSPLYYILQQPSLKYAWWLLLFTVLVYIFFTAKRTQRVIPVLEAKTNTSLEYIKLISALHYQNRNHLDMARKKMKYFMYFIRAKYSIHTQVLSDEQIEKLSVKSGVAENEIKTIFKLHQSIDHTTTHHIDEFMLKNFYFAIEHFYKHCK